MANVATHILVPMLLVETYRRYISKTKFSRWYVFFAGFMGAVPDFDLFYTLFATGSFSMKYHREITHSLLVSIFLTAIGLVLYLLYSKKIIKYEGWNVAYILIFFGSFGLMTHTMMDAIDGLHTWFYPLTWSIELPNLIYDKFKAGILDGALLLMWLLYDEEMFEDILRFIRLKKD